MPAAGEQIERMSGSNDNHIDGSEEILCAIDMARELPCRKAHGDNITLERVKTDDRDAIGVGV